MTEKCVYHMILQLHNIAAIKMITKYLLKYFENESILIDNE